jgi:hypothetical protein
MSDRRRARARSHSNRRSHNTGRSPARASRRSPEGRHRWKGGNTRGAPSQEGRRRHTSRAVSPPPLPRHRRSGRHSPSASRGRRSHEVPATQAKARAVPPEPPACDRRQHSPRLPRDLPQTEQEDSEEYESYSPEPPSQADSEHAEQSSDPEWQYAHSPKGSKIKYSFKTGLVTQASPSPERLWTQLSFPDGRKAEVHKVTKEFRYIENKGDKPTGPPPAPPQQSSKDPLLQMVPRNLHERLTELENMSEESKLWRKTPTPSDGSSRAYWYKVGTQHSQWDAPEVVAKVAAPEFKLELAKIQGALQQLKGATTVPPPPPSFPPVPWSVPTSHVGVDPPTGMAAIGGQDWTRAKIPKGPDLAAEIKRFEGACEAKSLSLHQAASYHLVFAAHWASEVELVSQANAMGFPSLEHLHGNGNDEGIQRIPPFLEVNPQACLHVPQWNLIQARVPLRKLSVELLTSGANSGTASIRGSRSIIMQNLELLLGFLGRFADVNAQKGPQRKKHNKDSQEAAALSRGVTKTQPPAPKKPKRRK